MNQGLWIARKNYLCILIKKVSDLCGGDDVDFLRKYCKEVIEAYKDDLIEEAIGCYEEQVERLMEGTQWTLKRI